MSGLWAMRISILCLALAAAAISSAAADEARPSQGQCDPKKIGARELADCLRAAADKSDKELSAVLEGAARSIQARTGLLNGQKTRWKRLLNDSQAQWLVWRDADCQDVAPFEAGMSAKGGDPRLACIIDRNAQRIEDIRARYP
jgi:uncharacterized protein YecT (DUF1311 family)